MDQTTRNRIRRIFLSTRSSFSLAAAAAGLGVLPGELEGEIEMGAIVAGSGAGGQRVGRGEMVAAAVRVWGLAVIEEALGGEASSVLPEAVRQVEGGRRCRGIRATCFGISRSGGGCRSTRCWRASWRMRRARMPRSWRRRCRGLRGRWRGRRAGIRIED